DTIGETKQNIKLLRGRVKRLEALIDGILQYSRIEQIKSSIQLVDLGELLVETTSFIFEKPKDFSIYIQPNMPKFNALKEKLEQVFFHLLKNAIQFRSSDSGFVKVLVAEETEFYKFTVIDNGPGIAPEYHKKIFEIFQTLSARDKVETVGIGLALVKKIIESVGGEIKLESDLGQGCAFHFWWPKLVG
ncbi:MAG: PAS/PAC sensor signal transduction histidine kinase, partial [bacterium]